MSFSDYAGLKTNITNWLARDDLTAFYDDWITLFEAAAARRMQVRLQENSASLTTTNGSVALPTYYLATRRVTCTSNPVSELEYLHPSLLQAYYPTAAAGTPQHYTIEGSTLKVRPFDDTTPIDLDYYGKTPALSSTLNWLYTNHPDAYLFGALTEAQGFDLDAGKLAMWKARRDEVLGEIGMQNFRTQGQMAIHSAGYTP